VLLCAFVLGSPAPVERVQGLPSLEIGEGERLLVVAPHPDDESLGAGGLVQAVLAKGGSVRIVTLTPGDGYVEAVEMATGEPSPRPVEFEAYGEKRIAELRAAAATLSGGKARVDVLGFPDGGLGPLLGPYYVRTHPERSPTTGETATYDREAYARGVPYDGEDVKRELVRILEETRPTIVACPDGLEKHWDHSATGLFTLLAIEDWARATGRTEGARDAERRLPRIVTYLVHWPHWPPGWESGSPSPGAPHAAPLLFPPDLPVRGYARVLLPLSPEEVERKAAALKAHATQQAVMGRFLASFERATEPYSVISGEDLKTLDRTIEESIARDSTRGASPRPTP
jgi:LmbE family N-acetylglucosaminyl deacetylase